MPFGRCVSLVLALFAATAAAAVAAEPAERIYHGGTILTVADALPRAEAVAVAKGRIVAVGPRDAVLELRGDSTDVVDLGGRTLVPGFVDGHSHFITCIDALLQANCWSPPAGTCTCVADVIAALRAQAERNRAKPGDFVVGYGYDPDLLAEKRGPTRGELDAAFPDNPAVVMHVSGHGATLNSKALAHYGITAETPTPPSGVIGRQPGSREPDGILFETAFLPVFAGIPGPTPDQMLALLPEGQQLYLAAGVTTAQEGATHKDQLDLLRVAADRGLLAIDVVALPFVTDFDAIFGAGKPPRLEREYRNRLRIGGVKIVADGSPQAKTAFFTTPYLTGGPAGEGEWRGEPSFPQGELSAMVKRIYAGDAPLFMHCNGDAAIDALLEAHRAAAGEDPSRARGTVAVHAQFARPDQLTKFAAWKITPSFYTEHCFFFGDTHVKNRGRRQADGISPIKSALRLGMHPANHTDFNVAPINQIDTIDSAVNRRTRSGVVLGESERVTPLEALRAITLDGARLYGEEATKGSIEVGKLADLVILSADPTAVPPGEIMKVEVVETIKEGTTVWRKR